MENHKVFIELLKGSIGLVFLFIFVILLFLYIYQIIIDIIVVFKNYNFLRAEKCHWTSCGLYYHDEEDPTSQNCLSPMVSSAFFNRRSAGGNRKGCRYSIQVREVKVPRKPAGDYLSEYLEVRNAFNVSNTMWRLITLSSLLLGVLFGILGVEKIFDLLR